LEKTYAKVKGGYLGIEKGIPSQILRELTGAPCSNTYL